MSSLANTNWVCSGHPAGQFSLIFYSETNGSGTADFSVIPGVYLESGNIFSILLNGSSAPAPYNIAIVGKHANGSGSGFLINLHTESARGKNTYFTMTRVSSEEAALPENNTFDMGLLGGV